MRILVGVGSDLSENRKTSKGQGFLGTTNQPRVSRFLIRTLTEYGDGQQVNIPALIIFVILLSLLSDKQNVERYSKEKSMDCNEEKLKNLYVFADSKSQ